MSHSPLTSEIAIREALARDDELRFRLVLQHPELQENAAEGSYVSDTEPVQPPQRPSSFNWRSGGRYLAQTLHFGNPAAQGSVQDQKQSDTYLGNDTL